MNDPSKMEARALAYKTWLERVAYGDNTSRKALERYGTFIGVIVLSNAGDELATKVLTQPRVATMLRNRPKLMELLAA